VSRRFKVGLDLQYVMAAHGLVVVEQLVVAVTSVEE
jgi:hypothetical protein